ncbi:MAG TPA: Gfo/Idh/MocA family oxidoreductase [Abditibacteriaceae bacterium]|jgi:predicted dehydrogenase
MTSELPKLRAAVIGGGMGGRLSLDALHASAHFELVGAADLRADVRADLETRYPELPTFASHTALFAAHDLDVVCVATFPPSHEAVTLDALQLPLRGLLVEKPLGHTTASGRRLLQAIQAANLPVVTPHGLLAKRTPLEIIERVQAGEIGDLKLVEIQCKGWDIINAGIHWLQFFITLTGDKIQSVLAACDKSTRTFRDGMQVETLAVTSVVTQSGIRAIMHTGDYTPVNHENSDTLFRLMGTKGHIEFYGWARPYQILNARYPHGEIIEPAELPITGHRRHLENLAQQIQNGVPDYTIPQNSLAALEICEAAYLSARYGCEVSFPLESFQAPQSNEWQPGEPYAGQGGGRDGRKLS